MNKNIMKKVFPVETERVEMGKCPFCDEFVVKEDFKDDLSLREFNISGMCQKCQDEFFTEDDEINI